MLINFNLGWTIRWKSLVYSVRAYIIRCFPLVRWLLLYFRELIKCSIEFICELRVRVGMLLYNFDYEYILTFFGCLLHVFVRAVSNFRSFLPFLSKHLCPWENTCFKRFIYSIVSRSYRLSLDAFRPSDFEIGRRDTLFTHLIGKSNVMNMQSIFFLRWFLVHPDFNLVIFRINCRVQWSVRVEKRFSVRLTGLLKILL